MNFVEVLLVQRPKIYLDTSVISHLEQQDASDKMFDSRLLWEELKQGKHKVYISEVVTREIAKNKREKQTILTFWLADIEPTIIEISPEIEAYADALIKECVLPPKSRDDCLQIACTVIGKCDMLLSWNFKHMVKIKTIDGVKIVSKRLGYDEMRWQGFQTVPNDIQQSHLSPMNTGKTPLKLLNLYRLSLVDNTLYS